MLALQLAIQMLLTMSLGFIAVKTKLASDNTSQSLSAILLNIGIPCIILNSLNVEFNAEQFRSGVIMIFISVAVILLLFIVGLIYRKLQRDPALGAVGHFGIMFTNYSYVGIPVMQSLYGAEGVFLYTMFTLPLRIAFYSMPPFILGNKKEKRGAKYYLKAFYSPPLIAVYVGMLIYLCQIPVPETIGNVLSNVTTFSSVLGMMLCGMLIAGTNAREVLHKPNLLIVPILSNLVTPLMVLLIGSLISIDPLPIKVAVMYTALPMPAMLPIWVLRYYHGDIELGETCSLYTMISTVLAIGTLPLMSYLSDLILGF